MEELLKRIDILLEGQNSNGTKSAAPVAANISSIVASPPIPLRPVPAQPIPSASQPIIAPKSTGSIFYKCYRAPPLVFSLLSCFMLFGILCACFILIPPKCISIEVSNEYGDISHRVNMFGCILMASFVAILTVTISSLVARKTICVPQHLPPLSYNYHHS